MRKSAAKLNDCLELDVPVQRDVMCMWPNSISSQGLLAQRHGALARPVASRVGEAQGVDWLGLQLTVAVPSSWLCLRMLIRLLLV